MPFSAWLYRIATNEVNGFYRSKRRLIRVTLDKIPEIPSKDLTDENFKMAERELEAKEDFLKIHECIKRLNPDYQAVIVLRFFEGKKIEEISQITKRPEGTIKSQIHRALKDLRDLWPIERNFS